MYPVDEYADADDESDGVMTTPVVLIMAIVGVMAALTLQLLLPRPGRPQRLLVLQQPFSSRDKHNCQCRWKR